MIMNFLEKIMSFLVDLNHVLYNWVSHILFFVLFILVLRSDLVWLKAWNLIGLGVYIILMTLRFVQKNGITIKDIKKEPLSLLVGFNLCVWVSLLSFPIILMLNFLDKKYDKSKPNKK